MKECSIDGCASRRHAKGLCPSHYNRLCRYGDPLAGGTFLRDRRAFFSEAVAYEGEGCVFWPFPDAGRNGSVTIVIGGRRELVTRLVCENAHGPAPSSGHEAAHSCGNGHLSCIAPKHLRWATHAENMQDMVDHGRSQRGRRAHGVMLTEDAVRQIRQEHPMKSLRQLAKEHRVEYSTIFAITSRKSWRWLDDAA